MTTAVLSQERAPLATRPTAAQRLVLATTVWMMMHAAQSAPVPERLERRRNDAGPLVVIFIVAIAVLLAIAVALTVAAIIFCSTKGMDFEWLVKTSWFTVKVACSR